MAKQLKIFLFLGAFAALGVLGTGIATAETVLCTDVACATVYPSGTEISSSLKSGTSSALKDTSGNTIATCTGSTVTAKTTSESGATISASISSLTWSGCSQTTDTINNGSLSIAWTSGTSGTVTGKGSNVTLGIFGVSCTYGTGEGTTLGTLIGGEEPVLAISAVVSKTAGGFLCPSTGKWTAEYVVTEPHALFVDPPRLLNLCVGANPAKAAFGGQGVGSTTKIAVTFKNECKTENIKFANNPVKYGDSAQLHIWPGSDKCSGVELVPAATCTVEFVFEPTEKRGFAARWDFPTVMGAGGGISYELSGTGT